MDVMDCLDDHVLSKGAPERDLDRGLAPKPQDELIRPENSHQYSQCCNYVQEAESARLSKDIAEERSKCSGLTFARIQELTSPS